MPSKILKLIAKKIKIAQQCWRMIGMAENEKEKIDFEAEERQDAEGLKEMGLEDLESKWMKNPNIDEELVLDIVKVFKDRNITATNKEGQSFSTALSGVNYKITIETKGGKFYSPPSWEVWNKIRNYMRDKKTMQLKVKVKHLLDGSLATEKADKIAKLKGISIDAAQKIIDEVKKAKKEKKLYEVSLLQ